MIDLSGAAFRTYQTLSGPNLASRGRTVSENSAATGPTIIPIMGPNGLHYSGSGDGQSVYVEYAEGSTDEDPIVRISGNSLSGKYEKTVHINEIDPKNATYGELCALISHQNRTGTYQGPNSGGFFLPVPLDAPRGDYSKPQNFMSIVQNSVSHNRRYQNHAMANVGDALLSFYREHEAQRPVKDIQTGLDDRKNYAAHRQMIDTAMLSLLSRR